MSLERQSSEGRLPDQIDQAYASPSPAQAARGMEATFAGGGGAPALEARGQARGQGHQRRGGGRANGHGSALPRRHSRGLDQARCDGFGGDAQHPRTEGMLAKDRGAPPPPHSGLLDTREGGGGSSAAPGGRRHCRGAHPRGHEGPHRGDVQEREHHGGRQAVAPGPTRHERPGVPRRRACVPRRPGPPPQREASSQAGNGLAPRRRPRDRLGAPPAPRHVAALEHMPVGAVRAPGDCGVHRERHGPHQAQPGASSRPVVRCGERTKRAVPRGPPPPRGRGGGRHERRNRAGRSHPGHLHGGRQEGGGRGIYEPRQRQGGRGAGAPCHLGQSNRPPHARRHLLAKQTPAARRRAFDLDRAPRCSLRGRKSRRPLARGRVSAHGRGVAYRL
mmetsp:Transcript_17858/g.57852  ORF Transcript_17858/g.57852 Transcript_17858/m.57852 type:complete len:390 (+) Transcript_17858:1947-3116(+)